MGEGSSHEASTKRRRGAGAPHGPREPQLRKQQIVDAAIRLFELQGVNQTSIDEVAATAGVAKGTFYHYFCDRDALFDAVYSRLSREMFDAAHLAMSNCQLESFDEKLRYWISAVGAALDASKASLSVLLFSPDSVRRASREEPVVRLLASLIGSSDPERLACHEDPLDVAASMFHVLRAWCFEDELRRDPIGERMEFLQGILRKMVGN